MKTFKPTKKDVIGTIEMLRASNCLPRWSAQLQSGYTEVAKQALNCQIACILFSLLENEGYEINMSLLPRIALFRSFEKYEKCDITEESYAELFSDDLELENLFVNYINNQICDMTSFEFFEHISGLENTFEMTAYKAATAIATYIEALEIKPNIHEYQYKQIMSRQTKRLLKYSDFPIIRDILENKPNTTFNLLREFSHLRNRTRWVKRSPLRDYSVLGHSFDVAVLNYLFSLSDDPTNIKRAEISFLVGLFHDLAENWTGDMPSTMKDDVPGLREKTEEYEIKVLERYIFPKLPFWYIPQFREIMFELITDKDFYSFCKIGDTFSAIIEASTQLMIGSRSQYFKNVVIKSCIKKFPLSICNDVLKQLQKDSGISHLDILFYKLKH